MKRHPKPPMSRYRSPAYRQALVRLDTALEQNTPSDNHERIKLMRLAMFADVDRLLASGELKITK
jgi:hypothetical protein